MTISGNIPAHIADRMDAPTDDQIDDDARLRERALDDLCDRLERGEEYPRHHARRQINRNDILHECKQSLLAVAVEAHLQDEFCAPTLNSRVWAIMREYLRDGEFHERRIAEMREEEKEEHDDHETNVKRGNANYKKHWTHCIRGHPLDEKRNCKICDAICSKRYREKRNAKFL